MNTSPRKFISHINQAMTIEQLVKVLTEREPHLKDIAAAVQIVVIDDYQFACAAIAIEDGQVNLYVNRRKFNKLFAEERLSVLAHEFGHLVLGHLSTRSFPDQDRFITSLAQDLALNCGLADEFRLPEWFVTPDTLGLPRGLATSEYIPLLNNIGKKQLLKRVSIPDKSLDFDMIENQKIVKRIVDKVNINKHLAINHYKR